MNAAHSLSILPAVAEALAAGHPVVALESTLITHGMPYPPNVTMATAVEGIVRAKQDLSLINISEPTRLLSISYAVFCLKNKT